ncbi:MAG: hypothetical protein BAJALOKI2v1_850003 [Promethearchaeota archaeon]|nr:MAG: hypothetical protein BAJALOKI2v1_850003 [Candidatus Lokiarchaeota archaeon]
MTVFKQGFENPVLFWTAIAFAMIGSLILSRFQVEIEKLESQDDYSYKKAFVQD